MKFHFMEAHRQRFRLGSLCRVLGVSRSGFYAWRGRPVPRQEQRNQALLVRIREAYETGRRAYGSPRVYRELLGAGVPCGRHRIARLMRLEGIVACTAKRFRWTANKRDEIPAAPNLLQRRFHAARPNRIWVSDITYLRTGQG
jgi:transposase InsO family protein